MIDHFRGKHVLVTGAAGLAGSHVLLRLKDLPVRVRAVFHAAPPTVKSGNIDWLAADLLNPGECQKLMEEIDEVIMLAAKIDRRGRHGGYIKENLNMHLNMLEAAHKGGAKKIVWLSSATAYPPANEPVKEDYMFAGDPPDSNFGVGWLTRYQEVLCRMYAQKMTDSPAIAVLRSTAIYGEYSDCDLKTCHVLPALMRKIVERQNPLEIWGDGETRRDFIYAGDVAEACLSALVKVNGYAEFNIGMGRSYSVNELVRIIMELEKADDLRIVYDRSKNTKGYSVQVDCAKAGLCLGFSPNTSLRDGLSKMITWYKTQANTAGW